MERFSTLYGAHTFVNVNGKEVNQYVEVGRSAGLDDFLKGKKIPNPSMAMADVNAALTGFVKLPGYEEQPADYYPMLVRYAPMHLKRLETYEEDVQSFNAIACSSPDHQVGNRDGKYRNTHLIDKDLLLKAGEYNYLDQIFGTHLVTWKENRDVRVVPIDYDAAPQKVQLHQSNTDAMLVQIAAAALINKAAVVLKLERGSIFQLRSMELLKQIYSLFAPIQAAEIGFSSYEDPKRIPGLISDTSIRLFVVPAEADLSALDTQSGLLILDLNQALVKPKANDLLRAVSMWYSIPWEDRVGIMSAYFADMYDPNDAQGYVDRTRNYKDDSAAMAKKLKDSRGAVASLQELNKLYDSFGLLMSVPSHYKTFCRTAPRLMKLPQELAGNEKISRDQRNQWLKSELTKLGAEAVMEKGKDPAPTEKEKLYRFCCDVFKADLAMDLSNEVKIRSAVKTRAYVTKQKDEEFAAERAQIAAERNTHAAQMEAQRSTLLAEKETAVNAEKAETQRVRNEMEQQRTTLLAEKEAAVNAEKANTEAIRNKANEHFAKLQTEKEAAVNAEKEETQRVRNEMEQQRTALLAEKEAAVNAEKANTEAIRNKANAHFAKLQTEKEAAVRAEKENTEAVRLQAETAISAEKAKTRKAQEQLSKERIAHQESEAALLEKHQKELEAKDKEVQKAFEGKIPMLTLLGMRFPAMAKPAIVRLSAIALVIGLLVGLLAGGLIGGCGKEPVPTDPIPPRPTPSITTAPTTIPTTTVPTTVPTTTAPRTIWTDDGQIDWDYVYDSMADIRAVANDAASMETGLAELGITTEGYPQELEAVITVLDSGAETPVFLTVCQPQEPQAAPAANTADPDAAADENTPADEDKTEEDSAAADDADAQTTPALTALSELTPALVMDNGTYRIEIFYGLEDDMRSARNDAVNVAQQLFREITDDDAVVTITTLASGELDVDLHALMSEVSGNALWWKDEFKLELRESKRLEKKNTMDTSKTPILMVEFHDGGEALVYDYTSSTKKRGDMVGILEKKGYNGTYNDTLVIGLKLAEQEAPAPSTEPSASAAETEGNS